MTLPGGRHKEDNRCGEPVCHSNPQRKGKDHVQKPTSSLVGMDFSVVSVLATGLGDALHRLLGIEVLPWPPPLPVRTRNMEGACAMRC